jgi:hypothetical protein
MKPMGMGLNEVAETTRVFTTGWRGMSIKHKDIGLIWSKE